MSIIYIYCITYVFLVIVIIYCYSRLYLPNNRTPTVSTCKVLHFARALPVFTVTRFVTTITAIIIAITLPPRRNTAPSAAALDLALQARRIRTARGRLVRLVPAVVVAVTYPRLPDAHAVVDAWLAARGARDRWTASLVGEVSAVVVGVASERLADAPSVRAGELTLEALGTRAANLVAVVMAIVVEVTTPPLGDAFAVTALEGIGGVACVFG